MNMWVTTSESPRAHAEMVAAHKARMARKIISNRHAQMAGQDEMEKPIKVVRPPRYWELGPTHFNAHVVAYYKSKVRREIDQDAIDPATEEVETIIEIVKQVILRHPGISVSAVRGKSRMTKVVDARQEAMWEVRNRRDDLSYPVIARWFNRDHTTVIHACQKISKQKDAGL